MSKKPLVTAICLPSLLLYILVFGCLGCKSDMPSFEGLNYFCDGRANILEYHKMDVKLIGDNEATPGMPMTRVMNVNGEECLVEYNSTLHSLDIYGLTHHRFLKRVKLFDDGPNRVSNPLDFCGPTLDSLFFLGDGGVVFHVNSEGKLVEKLQLSLYLDENLQASDYFAEPGLGLRMDFLHDSKCLQFYSVMIAEDYNQSNAMPFVFNYSLAERKLTNAFGNYPKVYFEGKHFSLFDDPSKIEANGETIVSFGPDPGIYVYDSNTGKLKGAYCGKSNYFSFTKGLPLGVHEFQDLINFETTEPWYLKVLFDPYRNCYYRFAKHRQSLKNEQQKMNNRFMGKWSIIVLDANFQRIGECKLDGKDYSILQSFVAERGLYISTKLQTKENERTYEILTFGPNK